MYAMYSTAKTNRIAISEGNEQPSARLDVPKGKTKLQSLCFCCCRMPCQPHLLRLDVEPPVRQGCSCVLQEGFIVHGQE